MRDPRRLLFADPQRSNTGYGLIHANPAGIVQPDTPDPGRNQRLGLGLSELFVVVMHHHESESEAPQISCSRALLAWRPAHKLSDASEYCACVSMLKHWEIVSQRAINQ